jgi:hypothetical protein
MSALLRKSYPWILLAPVVVLLLIPGAERFEGSNIFEAFWNWAWDRHHNMLSWAVRSVMLLPFIYFSFRRNWKGVVVAIILIATNFFWFPMPAQPDPQAIEFLEAEMAFVNSPWTLEKVLLTLSIPVSLFLLGFALWKRSLLAGLLILDAIFVTKAITSVNMDESGWALVPFLVIGLVLFNAVILLGVRWIHNRHTPVQSKAA